MSEAKNSNVAVIGCIGAIGAALITGIVAIIVASPTLIPFFIGQTATPVVATPIKVVNTQSVNIGTAIALQTSAPLTQPTYTLSPVSLSHEERWQIFLNDLNARYSSAGFYLVTHLTHPHPQPFPRRGRESPLPSGEG
jgi:hypothetical protein